MVLGGIIIICFTSLIVLKKKLSGSTWTLKCLTFHCFATNSYRSPKKSLLMWATFATRARTTLQLHCWPRIWSNARRFRDRAWSTSRRSCCSGPRPQCPCWSCTRGIASQGARVPSRGSRSPRAVRCRWAWTTMFHASNRCPTDTSSSPSSALRATSYSMFIRLIIGLE